MISFFYILQIQCVQNSVLKYLINDLIWEHGEQIHNKHGLRTPSEEIAFTARPKIQSQSQIFRYGRSIFCLPHWPKFSDFFDFCLHWVSVVPVMIYYYMYLFLKMKVFNYSELHFAEVTFFKIHTLAGQ